VQHLLSLLRAGRRELLGTVIVLGERVLEPKGQPANAVPAADSVAVWMCTTNGGKASCNGTVDTIQNAISCTGSAIALRTTDTHPPISRATSPPPLQVSRSSARCCSSASALP
jgi:hypothetical protein